MIDASVIAKAMIGLNQRSTVRWVAPGEARTMIRGGTGGGYSGSRMSNLKTPHEWNSFDMCCARCGKSRYDIERDGFDLGCQAPEKAAAAAEEGPAEPKLKGYYDID